MAKLYEVLKQKGNEVTSIDPDATVLGAAMLMNEHRIGGLVVLDGERIAGIFTERDVLRRVVAEKRDPAQTRVRDVMTTEVVTADAETTTDEARKVFQSQKIRHLPVTDAQGRVQGMVSIGDLNAWRLNGQQVEIEHLHKYIHGVVA